MLVYFYRSIIMEGENTVKEKDSFWSKPKEVRQKIYCRTSVSGYCDESEVESEVERLTAIELKSNGWGKDFSGWQRTITPEECPELAKKYNWDENFAITGKTRIEYLNDSKVATMATKLNAKQFAQYLKDYGNLDYAKLESIKE